MAGHSKWANIKHKKAREDARRGRIFSKLSKKITSAARRQGGDPDFNPELRMYIDKAKDANMPADNIERAIKKGTGDLEGVSYEDFSYEGYGPGGVAFFLEGATDNRNRTVAELRHAFDKNGGNLGEKGCVAWMFDACGLISLSEGDVEDVDELMMLAIESGATDVEHEDGVVTLKSAPTDFMKLRDALQEEGYDSFMTDELTKIAESSIAPDLSEARRNMQLLEILEDHDDVEHVYHNLELTDEVAEAIEAEG
jgi:YebC/PmpR family DNA-binding regulatory protein